MALYREVRGQTDPNYDQTDLYNAAETIKSIKVICFIMVRHFMSTFLFTSICYICISHKEQFEMHVRIGWTLELKSFIIGQQHSPFELLVGR